MYHWGLAVSLATGGLTVTKQHEAVQCTTWCAAESPIYIPTGRNIAHCCLHIKRIQLAKQPAAR